jgi:hypothetical protein
VAPNLLKIFFVSSLTLSGITISTLYPSALEMPAKAMPVLPDVGSIMMLLSLFNTPFFSASFTIQYAALSLTDPNGLYHSSFAKNLTLPMAKESNSTSGVFPI